MKRTDGDILISDCRGHVPAPLVFRREESLATSTSSFDAISDVGSSPIVDGCNADVRWLAALEQFDLVLRRNDGAAALAAYIELVIQLGSASAAVVHLEDAGGRPFIGSVGVAAEFLVALDLGSGAVALAGRPRWRIADIAVDAELNGTFLASALESAGIRAIDVIELGPLGSSTVGFVTLFMPVPGAVADSVHRIVRLATDRLLLTLAHHALELSSTAKSNQLQELFDGSVDAIAVLDHAGVIMSVNRSMLSMLGYEESEVVGLPIVEFLEPTDNFLLRRSAPDFQQLGKGWPRSGSEEGEARRKNGAFVPVEVTVSPFHQAGGSHCFIKDLRKRRFVESRLHEAHRLSVIGTLAAGLGHDLNNVMFPIRAHLNAMAVTAKPLTSKRRLLHLNEIRNSIAYLQHLADSLRLLALDPDGDGDGTTTIELKSWWDEVGALLGNSLSHKANLTVSIPEGLPLISIPPHALSRAMLNLLVNAGEAMPADRSCELAEVTIQAALSDSGQMVVIEVIDNGVGMSEALRQRAFDVFFTTKVRGLGTGLGLPLVRRVVERAGGTIEIFSIPNHGTTFRLSLRVQHESEPTVPVVAAIRVANQRVAALIRGFLVSGGAEIDGELALDEIDLLVVDADQISQLDIERWIAVHPARRLVVVGESNPALNTNMIALGVSVVPDRFDLIAIEHALEVALASQHKDDSDG